MKKSNKKFSVTVSKGGASSTTDVGTRSGVANFVRQLLEDAEGGQVINLAINVEDVKAAEATAAEPTTEAPKAE
jgi:hypothetical protein